ncbi:MAG: FHA domain-containing protein, partial [Desulfobacteraceae bacterium]
MSPAADAPRKPGIAFELMTGDRKGRAFQVQGPTATVGSSEKNDLCFQEEAVSRIHAKVTARNGAWYVQDLWSGSGTLLNGEPLEPGVDYPVGEGDHITVGGNTFRLKRPKDCPPEEDTAGGEEDAGTTSLDLLKAASEDRPMTYVKNMELLQVMSEALMGSLSLPEVFHRLVDYLLEIFKRIDRAAILRMDQETGKPEEVIIKSRRDIAAQGGYSRSVVERVLREVKPVMKAGLDGMEKDGILEEESPVRSVLCVPLISRGKVRGVIYLDSLSDSYGFRKGDLHLLSALASPAALAIENASLISELEGMVESRTTALKQAEEELRESEIRFRAIFNNMKLGAMVLEKGEDDFTVLDINRAALRIEGLEREGVKNKPLIEGLPHLNQSDLGEALLRVWASGRPEHLEMTLACEGESAS